jgi:hypothetical protein
MCSLSDILTYITYMQRRKNLPTKVHKIELMNTKKKMRRKKKQNDKKQRRNRRVLLPVLLMTLTSLSFLMDTIKLIYVQQRRRNTKLNIMTVRLLTIGHYVYNNDNN